MSAYIVGPDHLRLLVQAGIKWERVAEPDEMMAELHRTNCDSFAYRYKEEVEPAPFKYFPVVRDLDPVLVLKAILCYQYQSCEHPRHPEAEAWIFSERLLHSAIRNLPGYENAPGWEFQRGPRSER